MNNNSRRRTKCPVCREIIQFEQSPKPGEIIRCLNCDEMLEVIHIVPIVVDWPYDGEMLTDNFLFKREINFS
ncbi:hypothetical protein ACFLUC_00315 [Chloroflexota bacterium]